MFSIFFWSVCRRRNASFLAVDTPAVVSVLGTRSKDFRIPWIAALVVAAFCAIMLASCYHWWCKPTATGESQPLNLQRRGLPSKAREEQKPSRRHSSSLRRLSSRDSPNGWSLNFTSFFLLDDDVGSHILAQLMLACCRTCITFMYALQTRWSYVRFQYQYIVYLKFLFWLLKIIYYFIYLCLNLRWKFCRVRPRSCICSSQTLFALNWWKCLFIGSWMMHVQF